MLRLHEQPNAGVKIEKEIKHGQTIRKDRPKITEDAERGQQDQVSEQAGHELHEKVID